MTLLERLQQLVETVPPGGAVTLPRDWLAGELSAGVCITTSTALDPIQLTVAQVATRLHRSPSTVRGWLERGELEGRKIKGRAWLVASAAVDRFLAGQPGPEVESPRSDIPPVRTKLRAVRSRRSADVNLGAWRRAGS